MYNRIFKVMKSAPILLLVTGIVLSSWLLLLPGCSDRIYGDQIPNEKPVVYFVNIPPDGNKVSVNPVVHWVGTDSDGLVTSFRYIVVTEEEMGGVEPDVYAATVLPGVPSSDWVYLEVTVDDPQTTNIVTASADLEDPVATYVRQYIFVQAFDDQGLASDIVFRLVLRNDFPPDTDISGINTERTHINDEQPGAVGTGIYPRWEAEDPDLEDSLFTFQWIYFGPYTDEEFDTLLARHQICVFVTNDARVYPIGEGHVIYYLDTTFSDLGMVVDTTIILVDTVQADNFYGSLDCDYLNVWGEDFINDDLYRPIDSSWNGVDVWVTDTRDSLFDCFRHVETDSTIVRRFLFSVRSRDGADVVDLTPAWTTFYAVEPRYEREVIVIDFGKALGRTNAPYIFATDTMWNGELATPIQQYWKNILDTWAAQANGGAGIPNFDFSIDEDYVLADFVGRRVALKRLLQHKMMILYNDDILPSGITDGRVPSSNLGANIYIAIDAGVNAFLTMRAPIVGGQNLGMQPSIIPDASYQRYFGVEELTYSGWGYHAFDVARIRPQVRIEDFVGAVSMGEFSPWPDWPDLEIDTIQLHNRYYWSIQFPDPFPDWGWGMPFRWGGGIYTPLPADLRALPEVDWASRTYGTDVMYLYKSYYGSAHPLGEPYSFNGAPVAHRNNAGIFKTVHFSFTPPGIRDELMTPVLNDILDWLYSPNLGSPPAEIRYPDAQHQISLSEANENYWRRYQEMMEADEALGMEPNSR